eukprot:symbB.v1.2.010389.t1/scaffold638.1/size177989/8
MAIAPSGRKTESVRRWRPNGLGLVALMLWGVWHGVGFVYSGASKRSLRSPPKVALYAASSDTFDPWTVLQISPDAAYRKLAAKYHPDVDPSKEAYEMFQKLVRANAVITGEDKGLDETTLLTNAANNLRDNIEFQKERIERLKQEAAAEEQRVQEMQEQQKKVEEKRDQVFVVNSKHTYSSSKEDLGPFAMPKEVEGENAGALESDLSLGTLFKVQGKVALVTGGGSGIGAMIASGFVQNGGRVYIASRKDTSKYAQELTAKGPGSCVAMVCDVSKLDQQKKLIEDIEKAEGKLHILVNNSGTNFNAPLGKYSPEMFDKVMQLNTNAVFALTQLAVPLLEASSSREDPGRVIHISSVNGLQPPLIDTFAYSASKAAVVMLSKHLAGALGPKHITSNCICPGPFMSRMMRATVKAVGEDNIAGSTALSRLGLPEDIAGACLFLCSKAGGYVTGTEFALDGGSLICRTPKSSY